jgi:hypothetical protein
MIVCPAHALQNNNTYEMNKALWIQGFTTIIFLFMLVLLSYLSAQYIQHIPKLSGL